MLVLVGRYCEAMERHICKPGISCSNSKSFSMIMSVFMSYWPFLEKPHEPNEYFKFYIRFVVLIASYQVGIYLPCYDIFRNSLEEFTSSNTPSLTPYVPLAAGAVARSLACITCYPIELARTRMQVFHVCINIIVYYYAHRSTFCI